MRDTQKGAKMSKNLTKLHVDMLDEIRRDIHEHEILLAFGADDDAVLFTYWWSARGKEDFEKWREENADLV